MHNIMNILLLTILTGQSSDHQITPWLSPIIMTIIITFFRNIFTKIVRKCVNYLYIKSTYLLRSGTHMVAELRTSRVTKMCNCFQWQY